MIKRPSLHNDLTHSKKKNKKITKKKQISKKMDDAELVKENKC